MTGLQFLLRAAGVAFASALMFMVLATLGDGSSTAQAAPAAPVADIVGPGTGDAGPVAKTVRPIVDTVDDTVTPVDDTVEPIDDTVTPVDDTVEPIDDTVVPPGSDIVGPGTDSVPPPAIDQVLPGVAPIAPGENIPRPQTDSLPPVAPIEVDIAVTDSILEPVEIDTPAVRTLDPVEIDSPTPAVQTLEPAAPAVSPGSAAIIALAVPAGYTETVDHFISMAVPTGAMFPSPHAPSATPDPLPVRSTGLPGAPSLASGSHSGASSFSPDPHGSSALLAVLTATVAAMFLMSRRVTAEVSWRSVLVFSSIARPG